MNYNFIYPRFITYPYLKSNLKNINFPIHLLCKFKISYENLPIDPYISDKTTRRRRYANYNVKVVDQYWSKELSIIHTNKCSFKQNVNDDRKEERIFDLLENPYDPFVIQYITYVTKLLTLVKPIKNINIDVHQVRQITYPDIDSHNSKEGIHQDGADYVVPALVLNRFNIRGGISSVYDNKKKEIHRSILYNNDFMLIDDKELYHYVTPIKYYESDGFEEYGYRDLLGLDIEIIE